MTRAAGREPAWGSAEAIVAVVAAFAGARSESQILALVGSTLGSLFGADGTALLTRNPLAGPGQSMARLTGEASQAVHVDGPELEELMQRGAIFTSDAPAADLPGVPVPEEARAAVLVPCSSIAASNAVCAFWTGPRPPFTAPDLDRLRAVAAIAGLAFDRHMADAQARLARADLENRVRNVLAVIRSVGTRSAERAASMEDFLMHFEGRLDATGRAQLAATRDGEISFELLLREELLAQTILDGNDLLLAGMDVAIPPEHAEALRLAMHELAVNAVKFGPFGGQGGSLTVRWWVEGGADEITLNIDWRERCAGSAVATRPDTPGFGLTYLEQALPFQLSARTTVEFAPGGLRCQITVPLPRRPVQAPPAKPGWDRSRPQPRAEHAGRGGTEARVVMLRTGAFGDGR